MSAILKDESVRPCTSYTWKIKNLSDCDLRIFDGRLTSPRFRLKPNDEEIEMVIKLFCHDPSCTEHMCIGLDIYSELILHCDFEISLIAYDGSSLHTWKREAYEFRFRSVQYHRFVSKKEVFCNNRSALLPLDTLTVRCLIYPSSTTSIGYPDIYFAQTQNIVYRGSFPLKVNSAYPMVQKVRCDDLAFQVSISVAARSVTKTIKFNITPVNVLVIHGSAVFKVNVLNSKGDVCISSHNQIFYKKDQLWSFSVVIAKRKIPLKKRKYLDTNTFSLQCKMLVCLGEVTEEVDAFRKASIIPNNYDGSIWSNSNSTLDEDKVSLYKDQKPFDATLHTGDKTFSVHRTVLSARSPVFCAMFEGRFREGVTGDVEISDMDVNTMERMLDFIYTDTVKDMEWGDAVRLYSAADMYDIQALKKKCAFLLNWKLELSHVCEALVLMDIHEGLSNLRKIIIDIMLEHDGEILGSDSWKTLAKDRPHLTSDVLQELYVKRKNLLRKI